MEKQTIKSMCVTVSYRVCRQNVEMPAEVYNQLDAAYESCMPLEDFGEAGYDVSLAADWIVKNIKQKDAYVVETTVDEVRLEGER